MKIILSVLVWGAVMFAGGVAWAVHFTKGQCVAGEMVFGGVLYNCQPVRPARAASKPFA